MVTFSRLRFYFPLTSRKRWGTMTCFNTGALNEAYKGRQHSHSWRALSPDRRVTNFSSGCQLELTGSQQIPFNGRQIVFLWMLFWKMFYFVFIRHPIFREFRSEWNCYFIKFFVHYLISKMSENIRIINHQIPEQVLHCEFVGSILLKISDSLLDFSTNSTIKWARHALALCDLVFVLD